MNLRHLPLLCGLLATAAGSSLVHAEPPLVGDAPVAVPDSKGSFDFLKIDEAGNRLLAAHTANGTLDVFDLADGKLIKHIPTGKAQDVAVDAAAGKYYVSVSKEQKIIIIDARKLEKSGEIKLDGPADAIAIDPKNNCLYVGHDDEKDLWVIDLKKTAVIKSIAISAGPEVIVYDPAGDRLYQNIKSNDTVLVIDPSTQAIEKTWTTAPAHGPHGLAYNPETKHLFCAGSNGKVAVLDTTTGKVIDEEEIAKGVDQIVFDAGTKRVYCACGSGHLAVIQDGPTEATSLGDIETIAGAKNVACDAKTHAVWIAYSRPEGCFVRRFNVK